jgi:hypothetical protein
MQGEVVRVAISALVFGAATGATVACGPPSVTQSPSAPRVFQPAPVPVASPVGSPVARPPDADGDPGCPAADAWGREPAGTGILVTHLSDDTATVTVLVRTRVGNDQAQRASLRPGELRLFEFPGIDEAAVSQVLIMSSTRRCYVSADPAALG